MFFSVVAQSDDIDTEGALAEILAQCREKLGERVPKAELVFSAFDLEHDQVLNGILNAWPDLELIGCTTAGEMSSALGYRDNSVALVLFGSDSIKFASGIGHHVSKDISSACRAAVKSAAAKSKLPAAICITLPESLTASVQQIVNSLRQQLGSRATARVRALLVGACRRRAPAPAHDEDRRDKYHYIPDADPVPYLPLAGCCRSRGLDHAECLQHRRRRCHIFRERLARLIRRLDQRRHRLHHQRQQVARPPVRIRLERPAFGTFTSRLSTVRSSSPFLDITTAATELSVRGSSHPLEWQLASLHSYSLPVARERSKCPGSFTFSLASRRCGIAVQLIGHIG